MSASKSKAPSTRFAGLLIDGNVLVPPAEVPNMVRFALLTDPQGAAFGVAKALHEAPSSVTMPQ